MLHLFFKSRRDIPRKSFREVQALFSSTVAQINALEHWTRSLTNDDFPQQTSILKQKYSNGTSLDTLLPEAFALIREVARRVLGERMFDTQIAGGIVLHQGRISEMKTGEGKTLTSTTAVYLNSITGEPVHIVTVNDYLAKRDAEWMTPVFQALGQTVGYIIPDMSFETKQTMYNQDIVYATNNELGFDYLRDNLRVNKERTFSKTYSFCVIDEIDSVLIDEARTPLIISGPATDNTEKYMKSNTIVNFLQECEKNTNTGTYPEEEADLKGDYKISEKNKSISFTNVGIDKIERLLQDKHYINGSLQNIDNFEYLHYVTQSLRAHKLFSKNTDYIISQEGKVEIVDEFTGRVLSGRRYADGLHQAIEAKEGIKVARQNKTLASITFQNFFRMYSKLSGMTGTAVTEEKEFLNIYGLDVVEVPTNRPVIREDRQDLIYVDEKSKLQAIVNEVSAIHQSGQPLLIGTASIESSEQLSKLLKRNGISHHVLNAKNHEREAYIISEAGMINSVTIATNMAGRGTDIKLGGNYEYRVQAKIRDTMSKEEIEHIRTQEYMKWQEHYKQVKDLGGLYILGTERHESRRIDNQLRGRSGRQGDPGISQFYLSLDDQLMSLFGQGIERLRGLMLRTMNPKEPLFHPLITKSMERAQKNVEERNFDIRKHLLEFDSVLNDQRNIIYHEREHILSETNLVERLTNNISNLLHQYAPQQPDDDNINNFIETIKKKLLYTESFITPLQIDTIIAQLQNDMRNKASKAGEQIFCEIIRMEYIHQIDMKWQDHIDQLEELRQAVYLRSYAQKNPLLEYKLEGTTLFNTLLEEITTSVLRSFIGLNVDSIQVKTHETSHPQQSLNIQHKEFSLFNHEQTSQNSNSTSKAIRQPSKVGRNMPCPCGSGKKYKHCHGRFEQQSAS